MNDEFRRREAVLTGTDPGQTPGPTTENGGDHVYGGGGGGAEPGGRIPDDITLSRWVPAVDGEGGTGGASEPERTRWAFFTEPRISLAGAMVYVALGILIGSILSAHAGDGCPKGTQFYCWTDPVTLVMHCSCS